MSLDLEAIKARAEAATPGPWRLSGRDGAWGFDRPEPMASHRNKEDAAFIAHARTDLPALVAEVERLREENKRLEGLRDTPNAQRQNINRGWPETVTLPPGTLPRLIADLRASRAEVERLRAKRCELTHITSTQYPSTQYRVDL